MAHVFISYHKDSSRAYARQLADHLIAQGFDVWIDDRIDFGSEWERAIFEDGLDRAAAVIVVMTKGAWESRWVRREREYAEYKQLPIIPMRAEDYIFPPYMATQFVDVRGWVLPPDSFLDTLEAAGATRRANRGADVAKAVQAAQGSAPTIERMPVVTPNSTPPVAPPPMVAQKRSRSLLPFGAALIMIVIVAALLLPTLFPTKQEDIVSTPTPSLTNTSAVIVDANTPTPTDTASPEPTLAPTDTELPNPETEVWLDVTRTADAWTDTPTATFTATNLPTATRDATQTYERLLQNRDATLTAQAPTPNGGGRGEIAFVSDRDGDYEIYVMNLDGTNVRQLTENTVEDSEPVWSPDGNQIAFTSFRDGNSEIYVMNADGSGVLRLTAQQSSDLEPSWVIGDNRIAFSSDRDGDYEIYTIGLDASNLQQLTYNTVNDSDAEWSPDGRRIVLRSNDDITLMNADGTGAYALTSNAANEYGPTWSPDGQLIAFNYLLGEGMVDIYTMRVDGTNVRNLTADIDSYAGSPEWSPDGSQIAFFSYLNGSIDIYFMSADGTNLRQLANSFGAKIEPAWRP